jgi:hypothetical protein
MRQWVAIVRHNIDVGALEFQLLKNSQYGTMPLISLKYSDDGSLGANCIGRYLPINAA